MALAARKKTAKPVYVYGAGDGVLSFRHRLTARECGTLDRALEIVGRVLSEPGPAMQSPDAVKKYMMLSLGGEQHERFAVLYLDSQHRLIAMQTHFIGTLAQTSVYPREIVMAALRHNAAAVIFAHNHPSGLVQPSSADKDLTQTLKHSLSLVDVRVLDHVIVGGTSAFSMAEAGMM